MQVCDNGVVVPGCGCFTRNTPKYGPTAKTHCFLYPKADCATPAKGPKSSYLYLKPVSPQPSGERNKLQQLTFTATGQLQLTHNATYCLALTPPTPYKVMPGYMPKDNTDPKSVKTNSSLTLADCEQVSEHSPTSHQPTAHRPPPSGLADG